MTTVVLDGYYFIKSHITRFKKFTDYYGAEKPESLVDAGIKIWTTGSDEPSIITYESIAKRDDDFAYLIAAFE